MYCDTELDLGPKGVKAQPIIGLVMPGQIRAEGTEPPAWIQRPLSLTLIQTATREAKGLSPSEGSTAGKMDHTTQFIRKESDMAVFDITGQESIAALEVLLRERVV